MNPKIGLPFVGSIVLLLAGCVGTPSSTSTLRPSGEFATWAPEVQRTVLAGQIAPGFTREQVRAALGVPHYKSAHTDGSVGEIWGYREARPHAQYAFQARSSFARARPDLSAHEEPRLLVYFDHEYLVITAKDTWW